MNISLNVWDLFPIVCIAFILIAGIICGIVYMKKIKQRVKGAIQHVKPFFADMMREIMLARKKLKKRTYSQRRWIRICMINRYEKRIGKMTEKAVNLRMKNLNESFFMLCDETLPAIKQATEVIGEAANNVMSTLSETFTKLSRSFYGEKDGDEE